MECIALGLIVLGLLGAANVMIGGRRGAEKEEALWGHQSEFWK